MLRKGSLYVNDIMLGTQQINRIFNKEEIYWGGDVVENDDIVLWGEVYENVEVRININEVYRILANFYDDHNFYLRKSDLDKYKPFTNLNHFLGNNRVTSLYIDKTYFDTSQVTSMRYFVSGSVSLNSLDLSYIDTSNVTDMRNMFEQCLSLRIINLSGCYFSNVTDTYGMFHLIQASSSPLTDIFITEESTLNKLTNNLTSATINVKDVNNSYYIPSTATIHYNDINYKWIGNAWQIV